MTHLEKEWNKIKDFNILQNIEDLEQLLASCPNGICMRKYTSYPWSKENFFFGTIEDLLDWYKTTDEIPFYVDKYINKQISHLTITGFKRDKANNNELLAICQCDCGNIIEKPLRKILHKHYISCGCRSNRKKITSLYDRFKSIIDEFWDYQKNIEDPKTIPFDTEKEFWWKGYQHSFLMSPKSLYISPFGTSFPEQAFLYFLRKYFNNVENRYKLKIGNKNYEIDIFLKDYNIAIEYDGYAWHKNKLNEDKIKSDLITSQSLQLIRIRESKLELFECTKLTNIVCDMANYNYFTALSLALNQLFATLQEFVQNNQINNINITPEDIKKEKINIESNYLIGYQKNNVESNFITKFWSNKNLIEPYKISINSLDKFIFLCHEKNEIFISPRNLLSIYRNLTDNQQQEYEKHLLVDGQCPFVKTSTCPCNTLYHTKVAKPCNFFKDTFSLPEKTVDLLNDYVITGSTNILTTEYDYAFLQYKNFINNLKITYNQSDLNNFRKQIQNLLFYKIADINMIFSCFLKAEISTELKIKYIEQTLSYPWLPMNDIARCFDSQTLRSFYLSNINYSELISNNEPLMLNYLHKYYIIDLVKILIYQHKINALSESLSIIHERMSQDCYDKFILSIIVDIIAENRHQYRALQKLKNSYIAIQNTLLNRTSSNYTTHDIFKQTVTEIRTNFIIPHLEYQIQNDTIDREYFIWIYKRFKTDEKIFFDFINKHIQSKKECVLTAFIKELTFNVKFNKTNTVTNFNYESFFDENFIPNFIASNKKMTDKDIYDSILLYANFFVGISQINVMSFKNPSYVLMLLKHFGFAKVIFDISIFNKKKFCDLFFDFVESIYDKRIESEFPLHHTETMLKTFKNALLNNQLSKYFIKKCKETIRYIQQRNNRKTSSFVWVYDIADFNCLFEIIV